MKPEQKELIERIINQSHDVKSTLYDLRHYIEEKTEKIPEKFLEILRGRCLLLAESIKEYKIKKDDFSQEQNVLEALNEEARHNPQNLAYSEKDEFDLYQEFGFTRKDYDDLMEWQKFIAYGSEETDFVAAYNHFVEYILKRGEKDPEDDWRKLIPAATGLIGIGADIVTFNMTGNFVSLFASCTNGVLAISGSFKAVKRKLKKWLGKK